MFPPPTSRPQRRATREGFALVFFVLMVFVLMGFAALVIDLGLARLTQRQMQSAVDSAALEGLRLQGNATELEQREGASQRVAQIFDDNLDPDDEERLYGAGPVFDLNGGIGDELAASQLLAVPEVPVYKPRGGEGQLGLALNEDNDQSGDLVTGSFVETFQPGAAPFNAFLARMRRAGVSTDDPHISSSGPTVPFLFARSGLIQGAPDGDYAPRRDGIPLSATAIAAAGEVEFEVVGETRVGMALSAGQPLSTNNGNNVPGLAPFAVRLSTWDVSDVELVLSDPMEGLSVHDRTWNHLVATNCLTIGQTLPVDNAGSLGDDPLDIYVYVPIYDTPPGMDEDSAPLLIVGFGYGRWSYSGNQLTITRSPHQIALGNASPSLVRSLSEIENSESLSAEQRLSVLAYTHDADHIKYVTHPAYLLHCPVLIHSDFDPQVLSPEE